MHSSPQWALVNRWIGGLSVWNGKLQAMAGLEPAMRNAQANKIDEILSECSTLGVINVRRAYGNWTKIRA